MWGGYIKSFFGEEMLLSKGLLLSRQHRRMLVQQRTEPENKRKKYYRTRGESDKGADGL